jgi:cytochrome oxidase Cu insertion factor (SCO1/SenC/PrrC family)
VLSRCPGLLKLFLGGNNLEENAQMSIAQALVSCPRVEMTDSISAPVPLRGQDGECLTEWDLNGRISLLYQVCAH